MANRGKSLDGIFFLQLAVALFLIVSGLLGLMHYTSKLNQLSRDLSQLFGFRSDVTAVIISVAELISGTVSFCRTFSAGSEQNTFYCHLYCFCSLDCPGSSLLFFERVFCLLICWNGCSIFLLT